MANFFINLWNKNKPIALLLMILIVYGVFILLNKLKSSSFTDKLITPINSLTKTQPLSFPPIQAPQTEIFNLAKPDVPEEIGLGTAYPQGSGVGMSKSDSNSFFPGNPGPLLTDHIGPESYGESSLSDPTGMNGADQGCRVLRFTDTGDQMKYQPLDESTKCVFSSAYGSGEVQKGDSFINGTRPINYSDPFNPENNLVIQTSPGQTSTLPNCEKTYPNVIKYGDLCITEGDIPYGQVVDGK
jgi:hypothetical protein